MDLKLHCHKCGEFKYVSEFSKCERAVKRNGYSYVCKSCQAKEQQRRRRSYKESDLLDFTLKKRLYDAMNRAKSKNQYYDIDINFMYDMWNKQKGKCALTGIPMTVTKSGRTNTNVSIDRIDSNKGYTKDNVQLVCSAINFMKSNLSLNDFIMYCESVINYKINKNYANQS